ncbi:unnamed protein product [Oppiella nova]|uniref:NAD(+) ADP-ribosyltransferase n=1 Tax=Oppiella nova TaxID=334625 RepID=A0A7R9QNY0_9ACAR|nr:unnamed protein product [Oppiella nova]CAG2169637.1 unnamed protein product [Oppiella nova]
MDSMRDSQSLVSAASVGDYGTVEYILSNNLEDVNGVNESGWTALLYAANYGHFNIIRHLIRHNANVNYQDSQGRTALMLAACNGHTRCIDALVNYGKADKYMEDLNGANALNYATNHGHGNNKLIKSMLSESSDGFEVYQLRGRSYSHVKAEPKPNESLGSTLSLSSNSATEEGDHIFNPCGKTPFSNAIWGTVKSDLNPKAKKFEPSFLHSNSDSLDHSSHSSMSSSVISAPPNFKRKLLGKKQSFRKPSKSAIVPISAPMPKTLFHLLTRIDLIHYLDLFENNGIDFIQFLTLTDDDLQSLGIACYGHRKKLSIAQQRYHESLDINCTNESFLADFLLNERTFLNHKIQALEQRVKDLEKDF